MDTRALRIAGPALFVALCAWDGESRYATLSPLRAALRAVAGAVRVDESRPAAPEPATVTLGTRG